MSELEKRKRNRRKEKNERLNANRNLFTILTVGTLCAVMAVGSVLYTMTAHRHIWSGHPVITNSIASSIVDQTLHGRRGTIYDRNHQVLAQETAAYTLVAKLDRRSDEEKLQDEKDQNEQFQRTLSIALENGKYEEVKKQIDEKKKEESLVYVQDPASFARSVAEVLGDSVDAASIEKTVKDAIQNGLSQTELGNGTKRLEKPVREALEAREIPGLTFIETTTRNYPSSPLSSNMLGFADFSEDSQTIQGVMGLESTLDSYLAGKDGEETYQASVYGDMLPGTHQILEPATDGDDLVLTLDSNLQQIVEEQMRSTMEANNAEEAWCLVMEVETGKILAWASYPTYDQNTHLEIPSYTDNISQMNVEAGSVMKPFVYAAAVDSGVYPYNAEYRAGEFVYTVDMGTGQIIRLENGSLSEYPVIRDALGKDYGVLTFADGLAHSSNVAICELLANYLDEQTFEKYLDRFGFFKAVDIPYVSESEGMQNINDPTSYLSTGFGQASSVTFLQLAQAYSAIYNDGVMMAPYVVDSVVDSSTGQVIEKHDPTPAGTPISADAANQIKDMLTHVFDPGMSGEKFAMDGIDMSGKTGTGERYNPETGTYDSSVFTSSIIAAAPSNDPKIMVAWGMVSSNYINYSAEPFQTIMQASLIANSVNGGTSDSQTSQYDKWESYSMPSLINHSTDYAGMQMEGKKVNTVVIGDGANIIDQFPKAGTTINSNDNVILLTDGQSLTMPDLIGWTRKDLTALWQLSGLPIDQSGCGKVNYQSVDPGTPIQFDTPIKVTLE